MPSLLGILCFYCIVIILYDQLRDADLFKYLICLIFYISIGYTAIFDNRPIKKRHNIEIV